MNVQLPARYEYMVREKVESGRYGDASEVIGDALRLMEEHDRLQAMRAAVLIGHEQIERGEVVRYTPELLEDIRQAVLKKASEGRQPNPDVIP